MQHIHRAHRLKTWARLSGVMLLLSALFAVLPARAAGQSFVAGTTYYVSPDGRDSNAGTSDQTAWKTIQHALALAGPGATVRLAPGTYAEDLVSQRSGSADAPITITGPASAVLKGNGAARVFVITHDYLVLDGFTIDGRHGNAYRDKLVYVLGTQPRRGVTGLAIRNMTLSNAGGECIRLRYFARGNQISHNRIGPCGRDDFPRGTWGGRGKNGEGIYIGTAPEQRGDGKNPTRDADASLGNWIHHNVINTEGNECVDIKEAATANIVEYNDCTGQRDPNSAGFDSRGSGNIFRYNVAVGNSGGGIRLGGDGARDGTQNDVYYNEITSNAAGGIKVERAPQGMVCGNTMRGNRGGDAFGSRGKQINPTAACPASVARPVGGAGARGGDGAAPPLPPVLIPAAPAPAQPTTVPPPTAVPPPPTAVPAPPPAAAASASVLRIDGDDNTILEAEQASGVSGTFQRVASPDRSGGASMKTTSPSDSALIFTLDLDNGGTFYVWLLSNGARALDDGVWVSGDDDARLPVAVDGRTTWQRTRTMLRLGDGTHRFVVGAHAEGVEIDAVILVKDDDYRPSDGDLTRVSP